MRLGVNVWDLCALDRVYPPAYLQYGDTPF
jgi:hypothetical protein